MSGTQQELPRRHQVRGPKDDVSTVWIQQEFLGHRIRLGVGDQVLAYLTVDVVPVFVAIDGIKTHCDAVHQLVLIVGMYQYPHRRRQVVDAMKVPFDECAEVPHAGPHLLERLVDAVLIRLVRVLRLRVIQPSTVEARQVLVVRAGSVAQGLTLWIRGVHHGQRVDHPLRRGRVFDRLAQNLERILLNVEIRPKIRVGQHCLDAIVESVCLHELVVKIERYRKPVRNRPNWKAERPQHGHVGRLDPERLPVIEADLTEGLDRREREVPLRRVGPSRPGRREVGINFRGGGGSYRIFGRGHFVPDVAANETVDVGPVKSVPDEGIGHLVLDGTQVDVRQRCLRHRGDDTCHAGEVVGQCLVDHDITGMGTLIRVQVLQSAIPFRRVQCEVVNFGINVVVEYEIDSGCPIQRQLGADKLKIGILDMQGQIVIEQRHAGGEHRVGARHNADRIIEAEPEIVMPQTAIRRNEIRAIDDPTDMHLKPFHPYGLQETVMERMRVGVDEIDAWSVGIQIEHNELDGIGNRERAESSTIRNGNGTIAGRNGGSGVHRVHTLRVIEFGDVVDAVAINVRRIGHKILLHPVAVSGQRLHIFRQRCRARLPQFHQNRNPHVYPIHVVLHVQHEIVIIRGRDDCGNCRYRHLHSRRVVVAAIARFFCRPHRCEETLPIDCDGEEGD